MECFYSTCRNQINQLKSLEASLDNDINRILLDPTLDESTKARFIEQTQINYERIRSQITYQHIVELRKLVNDTSDMDIDME
jgi:hypothetical protein